MTDHSANILSLSKAATRLRGVNEAKPIWSGPVSATQKRSFISHGFFRWVRTALLSLIAWATTSHKKF